MGTKILEPLQYAQGFQVDGFEDYNKWISEKLINPEKELKVPKKIVHKRIFLLTDGDVSNPNEVIAQARVLQDYVRVHTFGISAECNKHMVEETAK